MSFIGGILRGLPTAGRGGEGAPEVLDMDELERRIREARARRVSVETVSEPLREEGERTEQTAPAPPRPAEPAATRRPAPSAAPHVVPSAKPQTAPATAPQGAPRPAADGSRLRVTVQPSKLRGLADDWDGGMDDLDWKALDDQEEAVRRLGPWHGRRRTRRMDARPRQSLPAPISRFMERGHPWQAAIVVAEVLGQPRALARHRVWPRR